jgi:hypothetical protein
VNEAASSVEPEVKTRFISNEPSKPIRIKKIHSHLITTYDILQQSMTYITATYDILQQSMTYITATYDILQQSMTYITNLVCYTYFHWFFCPECQHIFVCDGINRCNIFFVHAAVLSIKTAFNLVKIHLLFVLYH